MKTLRGRGWGQPSSGHVTSHKGASDKDKNDSVYHLVPSGSCSADGRFLKTPSLLSERKYTFWFFSDENYVFQQLLMREQGINAKLVCIWHEVLASETEKCQWTKMHSFGPLSQINFSFSLSITLGLWRGWERRPDSWRDVCQSLWVLSVDNLWRASGNGLMENLPICTQQNEGVKEAGEGKRVGALRALQSLVTKNPSPWMTLRWQAGPCPFPSLTS